MIATSQETQFPFGLTFPDLYDREGLVRLDQAFLNELKATDVVLFNRVMEARAGAGPQGRKEQSELILDLAPHLEDFLADLFGIQPEIRKLRERQDELAAMYTVKRRFIHKKALTGMNEEKVAGINGPELGRELEAIFGEPLTDESFSAHVSKWMEAEPEHAEQIRRAAQYAAWATLSPQGRAAHHGTRLFKAPSKIDPYNLVPVETIVEHGVMQMRLGPEHWRHREGFHLTDPGTDLLGGLDHANYCIKCHNQGKDSCSYGLKEKTGEFKKTVFGVTLAGCPLDEKISEMNT